MKAAQDHTPSLISGASCRDIAAALTDYI